MKLLMEHSSVLVGAEGLLDAHKNFKDKRILILQQSVLEQDLVSRVFLLEDWPVEKSSLIATAGDFITWAVE